jgi:hypothetical protein
MAQREFANQTALVAYAEQNDLAYEYEYTPAFAKWQRLLSPEQYEIVEARTSRGVSRVMLFSKAVERCARGCDHFELSDKQGGSAAHYANRCSAALIFGRDLVSLRCTTTTAAISIADRGWGRRLCAPRHGIQDACSLAARYHLPAVSSFDNISLRWLAAQGRRAMRGSPAVARAEV